MKYAMLIAGIAFLFWSCRQEEKKAFKRYDGPQEEIYDVGVKYSEKGRVSVEMKTPVQLRYLNGDKVFPDSVNIVFFDSLGTRITTIRSDSGRFDNAKNIYTVIGKVVVVNSVKQEYLYTSELNWNPGTQKVYNDKPNKIIRRQTSSILNGTGLDARQDFSVMSLRKVNGVVKME
ncbi:LPS export ABC transporter periplasmic protein LptC [Ravibacter arvi]